jgi:hypothetical protein
MYELVAQGVTMTVEMEQQLTIVGRRRSTLADRVTATIARHDSEMGKANDDQHAEAERRDAFERAWDYSHEAGGTDEPDESDEEGSPQQ